MSSKNQATLYICQVTKFKRKKYQNPDFCIFAITRPYLQANQNSNSEFIRGTVCFLLLLKMQNYQLSLDLALPPLPS